MDAVSQAQRKQKPYSGSGLKPGDQVRMVNCYEARLPENVNKVWVVRSKPWLLGHGEEVVLLEGKVGGFATCCLKKVD